MGGPSLQFYFSTFREAPRLELSAILSRPIRRSRGGVRLPSASGNSGGFGGVWGAHAVTHPRNFGLRALRPREERGCSFALRGDHVLSVRYRSDIRTNP